MGTKGRHLKEEYRPFLEPTCYSILKEVSRYSNLVATRTALLKDIALRIESKAHKLGRTEDAEFVTKIAEKAVNQINCQAQDASRGISDELEQEIAYMNLSSELRQELTLQLLYITSKRSVDVKLQIVKLGLVGLGAVIAWQMLKHCQKVEDVIEEAKVLANEQEKATKATALKRYQEEQEKLKKEEQERLKKKK